MVRARLQKELNRKYPSTCRNEDGGKRSRGIPKLRWKYTVKRDILSCLVLADTSQ